MKKRLLFYSIATLAVIALIVGVISYATERHPTQTGDTTTPVEHIATPVTSTETPTAVKKKACGCCAERITRLQEQIRKARERRQAKQDAQAKGFEAQQTPERASNSP